MDKKEKLGVWHFSNNMILNFNLNYLINKNRNKKTKYE